MQCKVSFTFTYKNGFEQVCTFKCEQSELESYQQIASVMHEKMMAELGAVTKLSCNEGFVCIRLNEVINLVVKGL